MTISPSNSYATKRIRLDDDAYRINQMDPSHMEEGTCYFLGNDPKVKGLKHYRFTEPFALVATSGVRCLKLACKLSAADPNLIPKIYLIDHALKVHEVWNFIKIAFKTIKSKDTFVQGAVYAFLSLDVSIGSIEGVQQFFKKLFNKHGYEKVKKIALLVELIRQDWKDSETFTKIANILDRDQLPVCVYLSNIVSCSSGESVDLILGNMEKLTPCVTILTNRSCVSNKPERVFLYGPDLNVSRIKKDLCLDD